jgi:hypothetical protein
MRMANPPSAHVCAAIDCTARIKPGLLMCAPHWRLVPKLIQAEVWTTWRALTKGEIGSVPRYREAVEKAVDAVFAAELNPADLTLTKGGRP